jgi:GAF domain-containing protein
MAVTSSRQPFLSADKVDELARANGEVQTRLQELQTLHQISRTVLDSLDVKAMMEGILTKVFEIGGLDIGMICLVASPAQVLEPIAAHGFRDQENVTKFRKPLGGQSIAGISDRVIATKKILIIDDVDKIEGARTFKREGARSLVVVPLQTNQDALGVMYLGSRQAREFEPSQICLFEAVGTQAGIAVQKNRLFEAVERRAQEQEALNSIARATSQSLRRDELLEIALEKILEVTGRERVSIRLKDPVTDQVTLAAHRGFSQAEFENLAQIVRHEVAEQVLASGQPKVVDNTRSENHDSLTLLPQSRSVAWIPMKAGANIVGILGVSTTTPVSFSQREVEFLESIGSMLGVALENARLFQQTESRNRELQSLYAVASTISQSLEIETLLQAALKTTINVLEVDAGRVYLLDEKTNTLHIAANYGLPADQLSEIESYAPGQGIIGKIFDDKQPMAFADVTNDPGYNALARSGRGLSWGFRSAVGLPITIRQKPLGVIYVYGRTVREFSAQDIGLLSAIGGQIGFAIENARLFQETEQRAKQQEALNVIAIATSQSLNLEELFEIAADKTVEVTGRQRINFRIKDPATGKVNVVAYRGFTKEEIEALRLMTSHPMSEQVFASGHPLVINDRPAFRAGTLLPQTQAVAWIPVKSRANVVGVLGISDNQSRPFSSSEVQVLQAIGNVIGVAIENARLFSETEARYQELQTLHEISRAILESVDIKVMMEWILDQAVEIGGFDIGIVRLLTPNGDALEPVASRGYREPDNVQIHRKKLNGYTSGAGTTRVIDDKKIRVVDLTQTSGNRTFKKEEVSTVVAIPLRSHDDVLGVIQLGSRTPRQFQQSELRILDAIGGQAGIAIQKARLHEATRRQAGELEKSNASKDELLAVMARQKEELSRLNAGLQREIAERSRAKAEIAAKNRDLETLLYVTSHDLREPLRAIENFSRMVNDRYKERLDEKGQDFLRRVILGAQRLNRLLDDILVLSRSQRMATPVEEVDGESIVIEAVKRLEGKINATNARVQVAKDFDGLRVDKIWATQAVYNLIANALKFTRNGEPPEIEIAPYRPNAADSKVIGIVVRDRGLGVAPEHAERIFQLFQRAVGREIEGTGAGLAIVRQIAERHGGSAWVQAREGGGSEFIITFSRGKDSEGGVNL